MEYLHRFLLAARVRRPPVHVLYAIEVPGTALSEDPARRELLEQSAGRPFVFESRASAESLIVASLPEGACAVELTMTRRFPEP